MNFQGQDLPVFKANLHTHTPLSDGKFSAAEVVSLYREAGYDVLAFTDHWKTNPVSSYETQGMTLLSGMELHPGGPRNITWHFLALGLPEDFEANREWQAQECADAILNAGANFFIAHPYWCGLTSAELLSIRGALGLEVYNSATRYIGRAYNMQIWDECLDFAARCTAIAVDDLHATRDLFRGFTMICAKDRSPAAILAALQAGQFYASQKPLIHSLNYRDGVFTADFSACQEVILLSNRPRKLPGLVLDSEGPGTRPQSMTHLEADLSALPAGCYVRLQIQDSEGNYAWSNPIYPGC
jgi:hypothetical protein